MTILHGSPLDPAVGRAQDLVLARLHLRLGSLGLARAELEGMAGNGTLDDEGLVDLAEARWRTGDLSGAGEAANVALAAGSQAIVAYVIAAESTAAAGRPAEARRLASRALELADLSVGDVFAGMPRASVWPMDPSERATSDPLFASPPAPPAPPAGERAAQPGHPPRGLWDDQGESVADLPDPAACLEAGRAALGVDDRPVAALQLGLALRLAPALAPAVLELLDAAAGPELELVRGDAFRLAGHERHARLAFAAAAAAIPDPSPIEEETT